jgi:FAD:protein FMN transferase
MVGMKDLLFRAMGSDAHVVVVGDDEDSLLATARGRVDDLEQRWSRFLPDSEVSALNRAAGTSVAVSDETIELVRRAVDAEQLSGGSFNATVLGDMLRAGYDRSFDQLRDHSADRHTGAGLSALALATEPIDVVGNRVRLPSATGFDPGGIGKGLAADIVVRETLAAGAAGVCVNLGGDLRVAGDSPDGEGWTIAIEHPGSAGPLAHVGIADGAVATSTTLLRRWAADGRTGSGEVRHHLIDPGTGEPSRSDLAFVTVVAGEAWTAEVLAKAVLLRGSEHPFDLLGGNGAEALAVDQSGAVTASAGFALFVGSGSLPVRLAPAATPAA